MANETLLTRMLKNTTIKDSATLADSKIYGQSSEIVTSVPMINVACSGRIDHGLTSGLQIIAGPSKHFKTAFMLLLAGQFLKDCERDKVDGLVLFYDSEFGTPASYISSFGIDSSKVLHSPITDIEQFKFDIMQQLDGLSRKDRVMIIVDSVGNLASKKEVEDAMAGKSVADMTRAKQLKSCFRMITPHLTIKDIPMVVVNHTYKTQEMYSKDVVSGGTGIYYSADGIWIVGRQQDKDNKEKVLAGYHFVINIEKSRHVIEKSKIPISVSFKDGIQQWSGMLEVAEELEVLHKCKVLNKNGTASNKPGYSIIDSDGVVGEEIYDEETVENDSEFWKLVFKKTKLATKIKDRYMLSATGIMKNVDDDMEIPEYVEEEEVVGVPDDIHEQGIGISSSMKGL